MEWSDKYDANAAPYTTPQVIKDWYQKKYARHFLYASPLKSAQWHLIRPMGRPHGAKLLREILASKNKYGTHCPRT